MVYAVKGEKIMRSVESMKGLYLFVGGMILAMTGDGLCM